MPIVSLTNHSFSLSIFAFFFTSGVRPIKSPFYKSKVVDFSFCPPMKKIISSTLILAAAVPNTICVTSSGPVFLLPDIPNLINVDTNGTTLVTREYSLLVSSVFHEEKKAKELKDLFDRIKTLIKGCLEAFRSCKEAIMKFKEKKKIGYISEDYQELRL